MALYISQPQDCIPSCHFGWLGERTTAQQVSPLSFFKLACSHMLMNSSATVRAASMGLIFTMGSLGGICAPWIYLPTDAKRGYKNGHAVLLSFIFASWGCAVILLMYCKWENKQREMGKRDHLTSGLSRDEELELSSKHPAFRYVE
jgi:uncharacterized membrane protein